MESGLGVGEEDGGEAQQDDVVADLCREAEKGGGDWTTAAATNCPLAADNNNKYVRLLCSSPLFIKESLSKRFNLKQ